MTNEVQNETKRNNSASDIVTLDMHDQNAVIAELQKMQEVVNSTPDCKVYDVSGVFGEDDEGNTTVNFSYADTHNLQIIPTYSSDASKKLVNVAIAITPKFDEVIKSEIGLKYLQDSYTAKVIKKIRDNLRQAILDGKAGYKMPVEISDFLSPSRAPSQSNELKEAIKNLVKMLLEKFGSKYPVAKQVLTQKMMASALASEQVAAQVYPFLIGKDGKTILDKWLEATKADFEKRGVNTSELVGLLETRHNVVESDDDVDVDDLF
jgi:ribosomal protein S17E